MYHFSRASYAQASISNSFARSASITSLKQSPKNFNSQESVDLELTLPEKLRSELEPFINGELSKSLSGGVTAKFSGKIDAGFKIAPKDGSYFIDLTSEAFDALIGEYLRPTTRKMLFGE